MDITAYWLNHKKRDAGEGKVYYFYPYTRCEKDDTPTLFIAGKHYVRIAVSEEEWARLRKLDDKEYNSERRAHNKRWTADIPRLRDEDGEEIDFWSDRAEDRETHYIEGDICEEADRRALVRSFDKTDRRIYRLDRKDFTQQEIARRLHLDQATVSRRLEKIYVRLDLMRLHDGERSRQELAFEVAWEEFLRTGHMHGDADVRAFAFFLRARGELLALLYKWFFTPGELLRYTVRYLMMGGVETKEELLVQLSGYGQAFFARQEFADEASSEPILRYRVLNLINSFHIEQLAKERKTRHRRAASRNNDDYIASALHFMQENYHEKLLLKDIADAVGLYPAYLQKIFRENRSTSVIEYLIRYRMEKSCGLLLETDLPVEKISELVGVGDLKNFYVSFRKYFNCTPAQYRKEHKVN